VVKSRADWAARLESVKMTVLARHRFLQSPPKDTVAIYSQLIRIPDANDTQLQFALVVRPLPANALAPIGDRVATAQWRISFRSVLIPRGDSESFYKPHRSTDLPDLEPFCLMAKILSCYGKTKTRARYAKQGR
jgi:hypothetical protein